MKKSKVFLVLNLFINNIANSNTVLIRFSTIFSKILQNPNIPTNHKHLMGDQLIKKLLNYKNDPELRKQLTDKKEQLLLKSIHALTVNNVDNNDKQKTYDVE